MRNLYWYDKKEARVSKPWIEGLRRKLQRLHTLEIDDLAEVAMLTDAQFYHNIMCDSILRCTGPIIWTHRSILRTYASLNLEHRSMLFCESGMPFADLTNDQQQSVIKSLTATGEPCMRVLFSKAQLICTSDKQGDRLVYTLKACTSLGQLPVEYKLRTPVYTPPSTTEFDVDDFDDDVAATI